MKILISLLSVVSLLVFISGCGTTPRNLSEFDRVWTATEEVLQREGYMVKPSRYHENTLVATSRMNADALNKGRTKVIAKIVVDQDGYFEPSIRVLNQLDISEASAWSHPNMNENHMWINSSTNEKIETEIYNKIQGLLQNKYQGGSNNDWKPIEDKSPVKEADTTQI